MHRQYRHLVAHTQTKDNDNARLETELIQREAEDIDAEAATVSGEMEVTEKEAEEANAITRVVQSPRAPPAPARPREEHSRAQAEDARDHTSKHVEALLQNLKAAQSQSKATRAPIMWEWWPCPFQGDTSLKAQGYNTYSLVPDKHHPAQQLKHTCVLKNSQLWQFTKVIPHLDELLHFCLQTAGGKGREISLVHILMDAERRASRQSSRCTARTPLWGLPRMWSCPLSSA